MSRDCQNSVVCEVSRCCVGSPSGSQFLLWVSSYHDLSTVCRPPRTPDPLHYLHSISQRDHCLWQVAMPGEGFSSYLPSVLLGIGIHRVHCLSSSSPQLVLYGVCWPQIPKALPGSSLLCLRLETSARPNSHMATAHLNARLHCNLQAHIVLPCFYPWSV